MMARHVVDSQHFQRIAPDMGVSPDEILFRAQPGCPVELGELAIHCVQPLPVNRPVLRQIVERLTAIENVDVHVGTTLVVAPSVARAARNMMRKREVDAERAQEQAYEQARMRNGYHPQDDDPQPHHAYFDPATSSVRGQANTWRMTDESNGGSSRMIPAESIVVGSQSTYKGKRGSPTDDSTTPLVLETHYRRRERTSGQHQGKNSSSDDSEDVKFRMPLWDSINSPYNLQELRDWHERESIHISTIKGGTALRAWDQERGEVNGNGSGDEDGGYHDRGDRRDRRNPSELSSLQLDLDDDDGDGDSEDGGRRGGYSFSSSGSSNEDDDEEDNSSLFHEDSDDSDDEDGAVYGHSRAPGESRYLYELSSDSDETQSTDSLTESVVLALDTLEIPDLLAARQSDPQEEIQHAQTTTGNYRQAEPSNADNGGLQRKHSLASRLLPPIPATDNPWVSKASGQQPTLDNRVRDKKAMDATRTHTNEPSTAIMTTAPASPQRQSPAEEREMDDLFPPAPPSKTSLLLRNNTIKSMRGGNNGGGVSPVLPEATVTVSPENRDLLSPPSQGSASTTGSTNSSATSSSVSEASSPASIVSPDEKSSRNSSDNLLHPRQDKSEKQEKVGGGGRGFGLIRGMSDSFWGPSTSTAAPGHSTTTTNAVAVSSLQGTDSGGGTITSTLVAAMSAKTWTSGVGGFGQWMGPASSPLEEHDDVSSSPSPTGKAVGLLKRHTSLKEGKQKQQQRAIVNFDRTNGVINEEDEVAAVGATTVVVKKRAPKAFTGISHRFSLVGVSALLLPKCDVCQKRLGVLPGWASKHLECDGKHLTIFHFNIVANFIPCRILTHVHSFFCMSIVRM